MTTTAWTTGSNIVTAVLARPSVLPALPVPVTGAVTWNKAANCMGVYGTGFMVQSSDDLAAWTDAALNAKPGVPDTVNLSGNNITCSLPAGAGNNTIVRLLVNPN